MSNSNEPGAPREPGAAREPGAPLKRRRPTPPSSSNEENQSNQPGAPRRRLFPVAGFLEDDVPDYRERAVQRILDRGRIGDIVEGFYQAQGVKEIYRISGPTNENPERHLQHLRQINERWGGRRKKTARRRKSRTHHKRRTRKA